MGRVIRVLVVIPSGLYGRIGAVLSALIVSASAIGLTMHKDFYAGVRRRGFWCYYTNLSNLLVLLYFALAAPKLYAAESLRPLIPYAEFGLTMCIMLTFCVFHLLLFPDIRRQLRGAVRRTREFAIVCTDNFIVHYLVPWLVFVYWLFCAPEKDMLRIHTALLWTCIPLLYLIVIFLRAPVRGAIADADSPYPYPFLDVRRHGTRRVMRTCMQLWAACAACTAAAILLVRLAYSYFVGGHALILI